MSTFTESINYTTKWQKIIKKLCISYKDFEFSWQLAVHFDIAAKNTLNEYFVVKVEGKVRKGIPYTNIKYFLLKYIIEPGNGISA